MACKTCGARGRFTIRGHCVVCAPELHAADQVINRYFETLLDRYQTETGRNPLYEWTAFDSWVKGQGSVAPLVRTAFDIRYPHLSEGV